MEKSMNILEKRDLIAALGTKKLIEDLWAAEAAFKEALEEQSKTENENVNYLSGRSDDCQAVKKIKAELSMQAPAEIDGKKTTEAIRSAWLEKQQSENPELKAAVDKQRMAQFLIRQSEIKVELARRKMDNLKSVIALRCAQITFFAGDVVTVVKETAEQVQQS